MGLKLNQQWTVQLELLLDSLQTLDKFSFVVKIEDIINQSIQILN